MKKTNRKDPFLIELGEAVKAKRIAGSLTQESLAELAGLSVQYMSGIENGCRNPSAKALRSLCRALDMSADYLLFGKADRDLSTLE